MQIHPMVSGHTAGADVALDLLKRTHEQVVAVANFRFAVRDFSAPRMTQASTIEAPTLMERGNGIDVTV